MLLSLSRRAAAEAIGTALLLAGIVGSGIMAERLAGGDVAIALLANAIATGGVLVAIILAFDSISGAHFNPAVTLCAALRGNLSARDVPAYLAAQITGAIGGVAVANLMFGKPAIFASHHLRHGTPLLLAEFVATFGLLATIWGCSRYRPNLTAFAVAAYIVGAYWFTSSTSFANPAVTIARSLSDTFAGIAPADVPGFIAAELFGALAATGAFVWLDAGSHRAAVVAPQRVLFVCIHNSARSQMAEAFLNASCLGEFAAESAGLMPGKLNPLAVAAMAEVGIDISRNATKSIDEMLESGKTYAYVVTVCDEASAEQCPIFPGGARRVHWSFADPSALEGSSEERLATTRQIRDQIRSQIDTWCRQNCRAVAA